MEIAIITLGKTMYHMKKKTVRAEKAKLFHLYLISTAGCGNQEESMEKAIEEANLYLLHSIKDSGKLSAKGAVLNAFPE